MDAGMTNDVWQDEQNAKYVLSFAGYMMQDLRSMVAHLSGTDLAVAGHAVALAGWHQVTFNKHIQLA